MRSSISSAVRSVLVVSAIGCLVAAVARPATAGVVVMLDVPTKDLSGLTPAFTARARLSRAGSVDQMLYTQPDPSRGTAADTVGFASYVGSVTYDFTVTHSAATPGRGGKVDFSLTNGVTAGAVVFRGNGPNSTISYTFDAPNSVDYNILHVYAQSTTLGSSVSFSKLTFTPGSGLTTSGQLVTSGSASASGKSSYDQWLATATSTNLDLYDWTMAGRVTLAMNGTNPSSGEGIKFEITGKQGTYPPLVAVPEPGTLAMLATAAMAGVVLRRARRSRRPPMTTGT